MSGVKESQDLAEVKAVLRKLQQLDLPGAGTPESGRPDKNPAGTLSNAAASAAARASMGVFDRKRAAMDQPKLPAQAPRRIVFYAAIAGALIAGVISLVFWHGKGAGEKSMPAAVASLPPAEPKETAEHVLAEAHGLLGEGNVTLARTRLLHSSPAERAEIAFLLAQSYDANYLRTLPKANSIPDRAEAERWYRTWYELAARTGLEMDNTRFQRIIHSLQ